MKQSVSAKVEAHTLVRTYPGWRVVFAGGIGELMAAYPLVGFTFSIFLAQVVVDYGWSTQEAASAYSIYLFTSGVTLPLWGLLVDRYGARRTITAAVALFACAMGSFKWLSTELHWYLGYAVLGLASGGISTLPYFRVISCWFNRRRGLALGIVMAGGGVSAIVMPALAQYLIETVGWQNALAYIAALVTAITLPIVWLFLLETPAAAGVKMELWGEDVPSKTILPRDSADLTARQALKNRDFWVMGIAMALAALAMMAALAYLVPLLRDRGFTARQAAFAMSMAGVGSLAGRVLAGWMLDHIYAVYLAVLMFVMGGIGLISLSFVAEQFWMAALCALMVGIAMGGEGDIMAYMVTRYFGLASFGQIYGYAYLIFILGGVAGPPLLSFILSRSETQQHVTTPIGLILFAAAAVILGMRDYRMRPGLDHDIHEEKTYA